MKDKGPDPDKAVALDNAVADIDRRWGQGVVMWMTAAPQVVETISTGVAALDEILGVGGWPRGRLVEVFGWEASGKTTLTLHAIAEAQRKGGVAAFVDADQTFDPIKARQAGVDPDALLVAQPDNGEQALEIAETLVRSGAVDLLVVDSVAALVPRAELEGEMGDIHEGLQARLMSQALRKLTAIAARTGCIVIFTNQLRKKMGITFGNGETTVGGNALKFYASVRVEVKKTGSFRERTLDVDLLTTPPDGQTVRLRVIKNKLAPPFRSVDVRLVYDRGYVP